MRPRRPPLTAEQILAWADRHRQRTGQWPSTASGPVAGARGETWHDVDQALIKGLRGLPGGDTLPRLLARRRGRRNTGNLPPLTEAQVLAWARDHFRRTGRWPSAESGPVAAAPGETWRCLHDALKKGRRGLRRVGSLARLLARAGLKPHPADRPRLTVRQILAWADAHHARTGRWPTVEDGPVVGAPGETWQNISNSLDRGQRGLPGGTSLARLLARRRGKRNRPAQADRGADPVLGGGAPRANRGLADGRLGAGGRRTGGALGVDQRGPVQRRAGAARRRFAGAAAAPAWGLGRHSAHQAGSARQGLALNGGSLLAPRPGSDTLHLLRLSHYQRPGRIALRPLAAPPAPS